MKEIIGGKRQKIGIRMNQKTTAEINAATLKEMLRLKSEGKLPKGVTWYEGDFSNPNIRPEWVNDWLSDENDNL